MKEWVVRLHFSPNRMLINFYFLAPLLVIVCVPYFVCALKWKNLKMNFNSTVLILPQFCEICCLWFGCLGILFYLFYLLTELMSLSYSWTVDGIAVYLNFWKMKMVRPILMLIQNSELFGEVVIILIARMFWWKCVYISECSLLFSPKLQKTHFDCRVCLRGEYKYAGIGEFVFVFAALQAT